MNAPRRALGYLQRALTLRPRADRRGLGHLHHHLLLVFTSLGDADAALVHAERARAFFEACGDRAGLAYVWSDVSDVYRLHESATKSYQASLSHPSPSDRNEQVGASNYSSFVSISKRFPELRLNSPCKHRFCQPFAEQRWTKRVINGNHSKRHTLHLQYLVVWHEQPRLNLV